MVGNVDVFVVALVILRMWCVVLNFWTIRMVANVGSLEIFSVVNFRVSKLTNWTKN